MVYFVSYKMKKILRGHGLICYICIPHYVAFIFINKKKKKFHLVLLLLYFLSYIVHIKAYKRTFII